MRFEIWVRVGCVRNCAQFGHRSAQVKCAQIMRKIALAIPTPFTTDSRNAVYIYKGLLDIYTRGSLIYIGIRHSPRWRPARSTSASSQMRWLAPCEPWRLHLMTAHDEAADVVTCIMVDDGIHARYAPGNETRITTISPSLHTHTSNTVMPGSLPAAACPWSCTLGHTALPHS